MLSQEFSAEVKERYTYQLSEVIRQRAWVEIDLQALAHNVYTIHQSLSSNTELMAVVKADAYGHGALRVAEIALQWGATWLATATLGEGIELRQAGITAPILILGAINTPEEIMAIAHWHLQPTICNINQALLFAKTLSQIEGSLPVHLHLDTGMSRLGTLWHQAVEFVSLVEDLPNLSLKSIYSHFATADDPDPTVMKQQHQRFETAIAQLRDHGISLPTLHIANSAATLSDPKLHYDMVRVGLGLYGLYPAPHLQQNIDLQPVLQVKASITQIKTLPVGSGVSYGHQYVCDRLTKIAVVGIGYADGVPRRLSNRLRGILQGQWVSQIGAITMDQLMFDISHLSEVEVGDVVTLIGKEGDLAITADDWAEELGTISWEILCGFKHRLPRTV
ncbi:MAG: alanine racemase [Microcystaceae cyanobacterium]